MGDEIEIRPLQTAQAWDACQEVQRRAWDMDDVEVTPACLLAMLQPYGGLVLGAYGAGDQLVGCVIGFLGELTDERAEWMGTSRVHVSAGLGVLPEYRNRGIATRLKLAQGDYARARGCKLALWTYDPLRSAQGWLNIGKLGGIARRYLRNALGSLTGVNAGLPSDRVEVEWWLGSSRVRDRQSSCRSGPPDWQAGGVPLLNESVECSNGLRAPPECFSAPSDEQAMVELPSDLDAVRALDMGLARAWQQHLGLVLEAAFGADYAVSWFTRASARQANRSFYGLVRGLPVRAMARGEA